MRLINTQGEIIEPGSRLHAIQGREIGRTWQYSHIVEHPIDGHRIHVTRRHPRMGHVHREFHPGVFGLKVVVDITWKRHVANKVHHVRTKVDDYLLAGVFALVPLAFFEHFRLADRMMEAMPFLGH